MYVLLDVQCNTDLIEILCIAKSRGISYDVGVDFNEITEKHRSGNHTPVPNLPRQLLHETPFRKMVQPQYDARRKADELRLNSLHKMLPRSSHSEVDTIECLEAESFKNNMVVLENQPNYNLSNQNRKHNINKENTRICTNSCLKCGMAMPTNSPRSRMFHARTHLKKMGFECSECGALFYQYSAASNHIVLSHPGTLATIRDTLTQSDRRELEKCLLECFTTDSLLPVKFSDSSCSVGSDVICIDDSDDDTMEVKETGIPV